MNAPELLVLWERAAAVAPAGRDDALLASLHAPPSASPSARNAALLNLRARLFGATQQLRGNCPRCAACAEFAVDCDALSQALAPAAGTAPAQRLESGRHRIEFRLPDIDDLRAAAGDSEDDDGFVRALVARCVLRCELDDGSPCAPEALPPAVAEALSSRMDELEPGASVSFELSCPQCAHGWVATMNVGDVLWSELQSRAERLLLDVDALARTYGWSEAEVLALSPTRRAAYLQLAGALG